MRSWSGFRPRVMVLNLGLSIVLLPASAFAQGAFSGPVVAQWLSDGRHMVITEAFTYTDSKGVAWPVPVGTVVDGASIPKLAWSLIGGPFEGQYRAASVVHDLYCDRRARGTEEVNRMFYEAMRTSGVAESKAKLMYGAVVRFGPKWDLQAVANNTLPVIEPLSPEQKQKLIDDQSHRFDNTTADLAYDAALAMPTLADLETFKGLQAAIEAQNPTLMQIDLSVAMSEQQLRLDKNTLNFRTADYQKLFQTGFSQTAQMPQAGAQ